VPKYVALLSWTDQGIKAVKDTTKRVREARPGLERMGVHIIDNVWTLGAYDVVLTLEAPDDETLTASLLAAGSQGYFRTQTMRAFTEDEMDRIIGKMP
jgi:uncharacterized protein with GYD domain